MAGYWPCFVFCFCKFMNSVDSVPVHKHTQIKNLANIQPSWPHTWSITHIYYSFKIIPRFKTTRISITSCRWPNLERIFVIHVLNQWHQMCSTLQIIEPMTSKWHQKCSLLQIIEPLTQKTWGQDCVIFVEQKNKERNGKTPLRTGKYFEWIIKQLLQNGHTFCNRLFLK